MPNSVMSGLIDVPVARTPMARLEKLASLLNPNPLRIDKLCAWFILA
jgi:hypothetical protein